MPLAVDVKNLVVKFGSFLAVNDVSFSVGKGEIFGFLGANGAGKTTTIRVICGLLHATSGQVSVGGLPFIKGNDNAIKSKVGYMSQKFTLYEDLTVLENLEFVSNIRKINRHVFLTRYKELLTFIDFKQGIDTLVKNLPGGIKQQVSLVASLLHDPEVIFLDEPTAGVTPFYRQKFWNLIKKLSSEGKTIFVTTHYMDEAENCNRIALMRSGQMIALGNLQELELQAFGEKNGKNSLEDIFIKMVETKEEI